MNKYMMICCSIILSFFNFASFSMDQPLPSIFPKELLVAIGSTNDEARDILLKTCTFCHQKFSINSPELINLINHPLFNTRKQNIQWLAFNAAWNANANLLKSVMRHMVQSDYIYEYPIDCNVTAKIGLQSMTAFKLLADYDGIAAEAKKYNCDLDFYYNCDPCDDLTMACYNKDDQKINAILNRDGISYGWDRMLCIGIDKNSDACINALSSHIKRNRITSDGLDVLDDCLQYEIFLKVAMKNGKDKAFEAIAKNDIFNCLNYIHYESDSVLDCITCEIEKTKLVDGQKYIDIYRKHGGRTFAELNKSYWLSCFMQ